MQRTVLGLFILVISLGNLPIHIICFQQQKDTEIISEEIIKKSINLYEIIFNKKIPPNNVTYIKKNIDDPKLNTTFNKWEEAYNILLAKDTRRFLLVEYLNSEFEFVKLGASNNKVRVAGHAAVANYLNTIKDTKIIVSLDYRMNKLMGTAYQVVLPQENVYGYLYVSSIPKEADVSIDGEDCGYTDKKWVLVVGEHSLVVKKEGYREYQRKVIIRRGRTCNCHVVLRK